MKFCQFKAQMKMEEIWASCLETVKALLKFETTFHQEAQTRRLVNKFNSCRWCTEWECIGALFCMYDPLYMFILRWEIKYIDPEEYSWKYNLGGGIQAFLVKSCNPLLKDCFLVVRGVKRLKRPTRSVKTTHSHDLLGEGRCMGRDLVLSSIVLVGPYCH